MRTHLRRAAAVLALGLLTACFPAAPPTPAPSPSLSTPSGEVIQVATQPGPNIDRPRFPDPAVTPRGFVEAPAGQGLSGYLAQRLAWKSCGDLECTTIAAPLDYGNPARQAITLALSRKPATRSPKLGTLFINPGGPGASGRELVGYFENEGLEQYDILGWDPRGVGASTPVRCFGGEEVDKLNALDASPDNPGETQQLIVGSYEFGKSCWQRSGSLLEHISTVDTVRDLDLMRQLVGDDKLSFLGYSYGTQIGSYYAEVFPQRVGRLVLDAAVDITDDDTVIQAMGFDLALGNFADWCGKQGCLLGSSKEQVLTAITDFLKRLDTDPVAVRDRQLTQSLAAGGIAAYLYGGVPAWQVLARDLSAAINGDGRRLLALSDSLNDRQEDGSYGSLFYSFLSISCLDSSEDGVVDAEQQWITDQQKAPIYGTYFGPGYTCALWPVRSQVQLKPKGSGAAPILVVGATGDPATPYQQAVTMAEQLESGVLVTYDGEGHGTFGGKSTCVDTIVIAYLTKGTVPADGVRCQ